MLPINYVAVLVAAVAAFVIGFLMHGPVAGKLWMRLANIHPTGNEKMSDMYGQLFWNLFVNIVTAYALAVVYALASSSPFTSGPSITTGLICGLLVWLGFLATATSIEVIWMGRSFKLWLFEFVSSGIVMLSMGAIIAAFN
jgi:hypothetical protein